MPTPAPQFNLFARTATAGSPGASDFGLPCRTAHELSSPAFPAPHESAEHFVRWGQSAATFAVRAACNIGSPISLNLTQVALNQNNLASLIAGLLRGAEQPELTGVIELVLPDELAGDTLKHTLFAEQIAWRATTLARQLTDARGNQLTPESFARRVSETAESAGLGVRISDASELARRNCGGILAIGKGSAQPPVLVEIWYAGPNGPGDTPPEHAVALAGKGVTFDSGGLSLKPAAAMYSMHTDCAGAATVFATLSALRDLGVTTPVYAALPLVENMPGPAAVRPGDVVSTRAGVAVEIIDTDFEGRVVLADAIATLAEAKPQAIVSLATLTYQIAVALGPEIAGLFARDHRLGEKLQCAAAAAGEPLWAMPWAERYAAQLRSSAPGASLRNHPLHDTGRAITAALFLGEFAPREIPFAHLDFAGPAVTSTPDGPVATGYGVRTLLELLLSWK